MALKKKDSLVPLGRNFPTLQIEEIAISRLKWNARSPRVHPEKQIAMLARNIATYGFLHPCLISDQNRLHCGTARVLAAKRLGMETVPAVRVSHLRRGPARRYSGRCKTIGAFRVEPGGSTRAASVYYGLGHQFRFLRPWIRNGRSGYHYRRFPRANRR